MKERMILLIAFLAITVVTAVVVLLANIGVFGEAVRTSDFSKWGVGVVLAEIVGATIAVFKWSLLPVDIKVNLDFSPKSSIDVDLDVDNCTYDIREGGRIIATGKMDLAFAQGGWQCALPSTVRLNHIIRLNLIERNGQKWEVKPFYPLAITQKAVMR
ncbi:MAG: hypothetical protein AOA65_0564 [Candidatus Bathyarchaeota archaeon BA1]|nr:MAG: hypothetical protein AOA65_0564 [Candidatus Bathyarchaeota archaeon BA1]